MSTTFTAEKRTHLTRSGLRQLREKGRLPGAIFGKRTNTESIHISAKDFTKWLKKGDSGLIHLEVAGAGTIPVLLEGIQRDPVSKDVLHVDFLQVQMDQAVRTKIPVEYIGTAHGAKKGGIVQTQGTQIEVEGLPGKLPPSVSVDISGLDIGDSIIAEQLTLPDGIALVSPADELLVSVVHPVLEKVES
ncbi:50S ribosomal protein L25 [Paenibacillus sp. CECT 9249]|uniref:50S ribosomal protein L25 n=1 Tax=Paenibacillus sp. CECT 9249 TaxID=2845385 RepID=UPI001E4DD2A8|nr:50S ribosomal protein L25 [Paenibacillus sp. CECT 9249]CAH0119923.1 50S ribosomal protein L25 [Paenibacillus sp. CECT 9249]